MFQTKDYPLAKLNLELAKAERNYKIKPNDFLEIDLYANKGERAIDFNIPKPEANIPTTNRSAFTPRYLIQANGKVDLPLIGEVFLEGYTLHQADSALQKAYMPYYAEPFVVTRFSNKRVTVLGAINQVVPLNNQNMTVMEVLALSGGISNSTRVRNIRLLRGDLNKNPEVYVIDLSTVQGMKASQLQVQENDIVYVEPLRRPFIESLGDASPIISIISSIVGVLIFTRVIR
ncbi:MAG: polysaccharide biosynthesis/export family protein [Verrucomicrobia bacterium]|nr:polysaccharide biosynthesis/export family protein [Cytophagales bacterium]